MKAFFVHLTIFFVVSASYADERILTRFALKTRGYVKAAKIQKYVKIPQDHLSNFVFKRSKLQERPGAIDWPVQFQDEAHSMGNNMIQYQNYGDGAYYHGGCDLRTRQNENIYAVVSGRVEAFYYSYDRRDDGSMEKYINTKEGDEHYFEVSIITDEGYRYEIHHIDPGSLSEGLRAALKSESPYVEKGALLGRVVTWPMRGIDGQYYHHVHFNIVSPEGISLNPEALAPAVTDTQAPHIEKVFARINGKKKAEILSQGDRLPPGATEILVLAWDTKDNDVYRQAPSKLSLRLENGVETSLDFTQRLANSQGGFPDIRNVYERFVRANDGRTYETRGDYQGNTFIYRLTLPPQAQGSFALEVTDMIGNIAKF